MKLKDLLETVSLEKDNTDAIEAAESPCEMLSACGINYEKIMRADATGADFEMDNAEIAIDAFKKLINHEKIKQNFDIELEKGSTTIKVYMK
jgi:hypothetical protein